VIKYKTKRYDDTEIEAVKVERESEASYWIDGNRVSKLSTYYRYHDSWEYAHSYLIQRKESAIETMKDRIVAAEGTLKKLRSMKEPK
jgi:hypothetical protein